MGLKGIKVLQSKLKLSVLEVLCFIIQKEGYELNVTETILCSEKKSEDIVESRVFVTRPLIRVEPPNPWHKLKMAPQLKKSAPLNLLKLMYDLKEFNFEDNVHVVYQIQAEKIYNSLQLVNLFV